MNPLDDEHARNLASTLAEEIDDLRKLMADVATGGSRIQEVNEDYKARREQISDSLRKLRLADPNPFRDLWDWYERWGAGDLPSYRLRRHFLRELYTPLESQLQQIVAGFVPTPLPPATGWSEVDRVLSKMRQGVSAAVEAEDFQSVGLLGREVLISLAQSVYDPAAHPSTDGVEPSRTDANRMLEAFFNAELAGSSNEEVRKHAKAALALAVALQHRRTADLRMAALCLEATSSVVNIAAIISGRRHVAAAAN